MSHEKDSGGSTDIPESPESSFDNYHMASNEAAPFRGPEEERLRDLARVVSHTSHAASTSVFGDFENPFSSDNPRLNPTSPEFDASFFR